MGTDIRRALDKLLFESLAAGSSLQCIADDIAEATGLRLAFFDLNNQLVISAPAEADSGQWLTFADRELPQEGGNDIRERIRSLFQLGSDIEFLPGELDDCYMLCKSLLSESVPDGLTVVRYTDEAERESAEVTAELLVRVYQYYKKNQSEQNQGEGVFKAVLSTMLLQDGNRTPSFLDTMYSAYYDGTNFLPPGYMMVDISGRSGDIGLERLKSAERELSGLFPDSLRLITSDSLLALLGGMSWNNTETLAAVRGALIRFSQKHNLYCGVSVVFDSLEYRSEYKYQARQARRLGAKKQPDGYVFFAGSMLFDILLSSAVEVVDRQVLRLSDISLIEEYDASHQANYLDTLEAYLLHGNSVTPAGRALFLDRSTLKYRIQKISGLLGKDIDDPETAKALRLGIALHRLSVE